MLTKLDLRIELSSSGNLFDNKVSPSVRTVIRHKLRPVANITFYEITLSLRNQFWEETRNAD